MFFPPGGNPCDSIIGSIACNPVWGGPGSWFEKAIIAAAQAVFGFAMSMLSWIWNLINDVTRPQTDGEFIYEWASRVFAISLPIIVAFLVFQVSMIVLRTRSTEGLGKAVAMAGVAVLGTSVSVPVVHLLTSAVDSLADDLTVITFGDLNSLGDRFTTAIGSVAGVTEGVLTPDQMLILGAGSVIAGAFGFVIFGVFLVLGSIAVFGALIIRTMLLYVTIVMGPLAIMGLAWEKTRSWFKIWVGVVVTLIVSKLAIMIVFGLGVTVLETLAFEQDGPGIAGALITGTLILLVAALMPVACFKFINFIGDEVQAGAMHGEAKAGVDRAGSAARSGPSQIMQAMRSNGDGGGGGGGSGGQGGAKEGSGRSAPQSARGTSAGDGTSGTAGAGGVNGAPASRPGGGAAGGEAAAGGKFPAGVGAAPGGGAAGASAAGAAPGGTTGATGGAAGGSAGGVAAAAVSATVKAGSSAAATVADQADSSTSRTGRTGPNLTRPSE